MTTLPSASTTSTPTPTPTPGCPMHRLSLSRMTGCGIATFVYGLLAYAAFFGTILYAIGFVGNWFVPKSIDSGTGGALLPSLLVNIALLCVFVAQHTIMARPGFKRRITTIIPASIERSTFVLLASASLMLLFWLWQPLPTIVWRVTHPFAVSALIGLSLVGWGIVFAASCMVSHWDLFGLRQVWFRLQERAYRPVGFRLVGLYRLVRHPLMLGFLIAFWSTPIMTLGHLFFAIMVTAYIRLGTWMEERDLLAEHGEQYLAYRRAVPGIIPLPRRFGGEAGA
ncbi:MAG TPA: hypothetical protein PKE29_04375 [Phycisphaerales bacterium]|nr:hypothetical protein [Phycisphaerales bacterium]